MNIEEVIAGKNDQEEVSVDGTALPVAALKALVRDGYEQIKPYEAEKTFSCWGKSCTGCFTVEEIRNRR